MGDRRFRICQLGRAVRIAVERKQASRVHGALGKVVVEVLPRRIAVDFNRDLRPRRRDS